MKVTEETKVTISLVILITLLVGVVSMSFAVGRKLENFDGRVAIVEESMSEHGEIRAMAERNGNRLSAQDIKLAEIQTDLKWIRRTMEESAND